MQIYIYIYIFIFADVLAYMPILRGSRNSEYIPLEGLYIFLVSGAAGSRERTYETNGILSPPPPP